MSKEDNKILDIISSYFNLELSDKEMASFEERIKEDPSFAEKVALFKESLDIVDDAYSNEEEQLRQKEWRSIISKNKPLNKVIRLQWISTIAASILLVTLIYYLVPSNPDYNKLVESAWNKKVGLDFIVRNSNNEKDSILKAYKAYENKDYTLSLKILSIYDSTSVSYKDVILLRALSKYRMKNIEDAFKYLDTLKTYNPNVSRWYKGLIYLENKDFENAKNYIVIPQNAYEIKLKN